MNRILLILSTAFSILGNAQNVNIPDPAFKNYLVTNLDINYNGDSEIQLTEANAYVGEILCMGQNIYDLTGIEEFTEITLLHAAMNHISTLDLSQNTDLEIVICAMNNISSVNVTNCPLLKELVLNDNSLSILDVTQNPLLTRLELPNNNIGSLDISQNPLLEIFDASSSPLYTLDVSMHQNLNKLYCDGCDLSSLDLSNNPQLKYLEVMVNHISSFDFSNNPLLEYARVDINDMTTLDFSSNTNLHAVGFFSCENLLTVNMANGNNTDITNIQANGNPQITCIQVDEVAYSQANWFLVDDSSVFSLNCSMSLEEMNGVDFLISPNPCTNEINFSSGQSTDILRIEFINALGQIVKEIEPQKEFETFRIDISDLMSGTYTVNAKMKDGNYLKRQKLVKM